MRKSILLITISLLVIIGLLPKPAYSDTDAILYLSGIPGESVVTDYENWIDILGWSWQLSNPSAGATPGEESSPAVIRPVILLKYIDKTSPHISFNILNGTWINQAIFVLKPAGPDGQEYLRLTMQSVQFANTSTGGDVTDDKATESVALVFSKICYDYTPLSPDGTTGATISRCFDVEINQEYQP